MIVHINISECIKNIRSEGRRNNLMTFFFRRRRREKKMRATKTIIKNVVGLTENNKKCIQHMTIPCHNENILMKKFKLFRNKLSFSNLDSTGKSDHFYASHWLKLSSARILKVLHNSKLKSTLTSNSFTLGVVNKRRHTF